LRETLPYGGGSERRPVLDMPEPMEPARTRHSQIPREELERELENESIQQPPVCAGTESQWVEPYG
jgi:hypothetical protein